MQPAQRAGRVRVVVVALTAALGVATSCAPPPSPQPSPWVPQGCYQHSSPLMSPADLWFSGVADQRGNLESRGTWDGFVWSASTDGSCSGPDTFHGTMVRATSAETATQRCRRLGHLSPEPPLQLAALGYPMPVDAWACALTAEELI